MQRADAVALGIILADDCAALTDLPEGSSTDGCAEGDKPKSNLATAARDLGASAWTAFWRVVVPLSAPGLVTGAILVFVPVLSAVLEPELLGGPSSRLTPTAIRSQFFHTLNWPLGAALTVVFMFLGGIAIGMLGWLFVYFVAGLRAAPRETHLAGIHAGRLGFLEIWNPTEMRTCIRPPGLGKNRMSR